jgi:hypothetical protein
VKSVQLVEQHCISKNDPRYAIIDEAAFKSKNLYNAALYEMRQAFIHQGIYLSYEQGTHDIWATFCATRVQHEERMVKESRCPKGETR